MVSIWLTRSPRTSARGSCGFSMVELIVAMALTTMLLGGVVAIFASSRSSYATTDRLSQIQERGRLALDRLIFDVRSAGFDGCAREPAFVSTSLNAANDLKFDFLDSPVRGYQYVGSGEWRPALDRSHVAGVAEDSDVLVLRGPRRNANPLRLQANMATGADELVVSDAATSSLKAGDIAMAYSCEAQAYFHVSSFADGTIHHARSPSGEAPGNAVDTIGYAFRANAEVTPVQTVIYYVHADESGTKSLWRRVGQQEPQELVAGVERMQLQFGLDPASSASAASYVTADAVADWNAVNSVAVALLVRSQDSAASDADQKSYHLLDVAVPATADGHLREVFTATAGIRNRVTTR